MGRWLHVREISQKGIMGGSVCPEFALMVQFDPKKLSKKPPSRAKRGFVGNSLHDRGDSPQIRTIIMVRI